jgi:hypothetical protein
MQALTLAALGAVAGIEMARGAKPKDKEDY